MEFDGLLASIIQEMTEKVSLTTSLTALVSINAGL